MSRYEVPTYTTSETDKVICVNRREHEHGALTDKALSAVLQKNFAFTVRCTGEVLESNGHYL